jgi:predicted dehydrogenase
LLKLGIVGAGLRGRHFADALHHRSDVEVVGFAELSAHAAAGAREATGLPVVSSHTDLMTDFSPDAVVIATPDFAHRDVAVDLAAHGTHLLIEKPLATTVPDAVAITEAVEKGGGRCLVGFENRWNPHVLRAKDELAALGRPLTATAVLSNSYYVPTRMLAWAAASSPIWFLMPHTLDLVMWLTGRTPASVYAAGSRGVLRARGVDTWDVVHATLVFDDGTTGSLSSAWVLPDAGEGIVEFAFQVIASDGAVRADLGHQGLTVVSDKTYSAWPLGARVGRSVTGPPGWMANDFVSGLLEGTELGPGARHGLLVTTVLAAIERSLRLGQPVPVEAEAPPRAPAGGQAPSSAP